MRRTPCCSSTSNWAGGRVQPRGSSVQLAGPCACLPSTLSGSFASSSINHHLLARYDGVFFLFVIVGKKSQGDHCVAAGAEEVGLMKKITTKASMEWSLTILLTPSFSSASSRPSLSLADARIASLLRSWSMVPSSSKRATSKS